MANYPTSLDTLTNPSAGQKTNDSSVPHATQHANANDILEALEAKVGITASTPARNKALIGAASGSIWDVNARKNRLFNGCMRVKQRAAMPTGDDQYCLDRWNLLVEATNAVTVDQEASDNPTGPRALKLTVGSANNNKFGVVNVMEFLDSADLRNNTVSLQVKIRATSGISDVRIGIVEWSGTADAITSDIVSSWEAAGTNPTLAANWAFLNTPANISPQTAWTTHRVENIAVGSNCSNLGVFIWCNDKTTTTTTDILRIADVQLEEGAVCTEFEFRPYVIEEMYCKRYFEALGSAVFNALGAGQWTSGTAARYIVTFAPKRVLPSVAISSVDHFEIMTPAASSTTATYFGGVALTGLDRVGLDFTCPGGGAAGQASLLFLNTASGCINIGAEL